jgi:predicted membrane-bound spermidine synthase
MHAHTGTTSIEGCGIAAAADGIGAVDHSTAVHYRVVVLFFVSGAAALIYQICWQRLLFESVGVDIESVTIIVSTFMLGLGLGSLAGGELADRYPGRTLELFALIELTAAVFGVCSPVLIRAASAAIVHGSLAAIVAVNFGLLLVPTALMGATLPILVTHVVRVYRNVGVSVGVLYFANTLGAALGAGLTGFVALYYLGLTHTIYVAAAINVSVSAAVSLTMRKARV